MQQDRPGNDHNDQLVFDSKQTVWIVSAFLLLLFFVFMVGYFLGKHQAVEQFSHALDQESISDKIYSSLYASYEGKTGIELDNDKPETDKVEAETTETNTLALANRPATTESGNQEKENKADATKPDQAAKPQDNTKSAGYYAPLIGFGSQKAAQAYFNHLTHDYGFPVELKNRTSQTGKGRVIRWYQITTATFKSRSDLEKLLVKLEKKEHLTNIKIVTVP